MIIIGGMGSLLGALLGAAFVTLFPYVIEAALLKLPDAQSYAGVLFAVNYAAFGVGHDLVSGVRAARARRHLAPRAELFSALAVQASAGRGSAQMSEPALLTVDKLEVVYQRAITAVQGITLSVRDGQIVAMLGTNGAGKSTTLRAISGFLGIDDARVTEGSVSSKAAHREPAAAMKSPASASRWCPSARRCFPISRLPKIWPRRSRRRGAAGARERRFRLSFLSASRANCAAETAGLLSGGERQMLALASALVCRPSCCWSMNCRSASRPSSSRI